MQENTDRETQSGAAPPEMEAHRNAIGEMLQKLSEKGIDLEKVAESAGISTTDVDALSHDDLLSLTTYIGKSHPEVLQSVSARYPAAQQLIAMLSGGSLGGMLGGIFGRQEPEDPEHKT